MNILWITLETVLPANSGGRLGVYKRLEQVVKTENVYLFYPYDIDDELRYADELRKLCVEVYPYYRERNKKRALLNIWKYPFTVGSRCIPQMHADIQMCIKTNKIDVINVDFPHMCSNLLDLAVTLPIVLNEHNIEWKVYKTIANSQKNVMKKIAYWVDSFRLKRFEDEVFKKLNIVKVTFVSENDMDYMTRVGLVDKEKCALIPVGADIKLSKTRKKKEISKGKNIIFVGKMSYGPNIEAVTWFVNQIFPEILRQVPNTKFYIVGKDPVEEVKSLKSENIIVTGIVDSVDEYYDIADLVVLPLKNGGGVKIKLLEAVSFRKTIVSTSVGTEGTIYADGETISVIDDTYGFAEKCIEALLSNTKDRTKAAYDIFIKNYTWEIIGKKYIAVMNAVIKK